jgi:hypothetical protein
MHQQQWLLDRTAARPPCGEKEKRVNERQRKFWNCALSRSLLAPSPWPPTWPRLHPDAPRWEKIGGDWHLDGKRIVPGTVIRCRDPRDVPSPPLCDLGRPIYVFSADGVYANGVRVVEFDRRRL